MMDRPVPQSIPECEPAYTVRVSARAKRLQLRVSPAGKVEVVVPRHVSLARVEPFVRQHRAWLKRTLAKMCALRPAAPAGEAIPERLLLAGLAEDWRIERCPGPRPRVTAAMIEPGRGALTVTAADAAAARAALRGWLRDHARRHLSVRLQAISEECGLSYARLTVRAQRTRWGSCSARGHISLNWQMIFLPPPLLRYLCVHELCHTVHLNHSRRYWALVGRHAPDYADHERELRRASHHVPFWVNVER